MGPGVFDPCWRGFAPMAEYLGGLSRPRAPSGGLWTTLRVAHRLTRGFRAFGAPTSGASMVLQTLFPPIACRLSRLVSSSGVPPQSAEGTAGAGAQPPGAGAAGPAVQGAIVPSGD